VGNRSGLPDRLLGTAHARYPSTTAGLWEYARAAVDLRAAAIFGWAAVESLLLAGDGNADTAMVMHTSATARLG
jgi:hypothetical protein